MNIMSLDLEMNQPSRTIIQIGVAIGDLQTGEVLYKTCMNVFTSEQISEFITKLTGITQTDVYNGNWLLNIYHILEALHLDYNCFRNPLTWGGGDSDTLRQQLGLDTERYLFGRRWIDAKTLFISRCFAREETHQSGLSKALTRMNMKFEGRKHNAMDDAVNTFRIYYEMLRELRYPPDSMRI